MHADVLFTKMSRFIKKIYFLSEIAGK